MFVKSSSRALLFSALAVLLLAMAIGCAPAAQPAPTTAPAASGAASPTKAPVVAASPTATASRATGTASATGTPTTGAASTGAIAVQPSGNLSGEIKLGAIESLTGDNSSYGVSIKNALDLATQEINQNKFLGNATISLTTL